MVAQLATTELNDDAQPGALCANPECKRPLARTAFPLALVDDYCRECRERREAEGWHARAVAAIRSLSPAGREAVAA